MKHGIDPTEKPCCYKKLYIYGNGHKFLKLVYVDGEEHYEWKPETGWVLIHRFIGEELIY